MGAGNLRVTSSAGAPSRRTMRRAPSLPALSTAAPSSPNISLSFMFVVDKRGHETATTPEGSVMRMRLPRAVV